MKGSRAYHASRDEEHVSANEWPSVATLDQKVEANDKVEVLERDVDAGVRGERRRG